jgi:aryl-alcohol dehydrogenase-like predicted oxidoreductase
MTQQMYLGGTFPLPDESMTVNRMGYGAMQLAGPQVWGPPRDVDEAIAVLREAVAAGVNHIDTSDFYGPQVTNQIIKRALHPYPDDPLGGFSPLQSSVLDAAAASLQARPMQVALAWLLQRSPNILLIPGTSSVNHLHENLKAATLHIPSEIITDLDSIGGGAAR